MNYNVFEESWKATWGVIIILKKMTLLLNSVLTLQPSLTIVYQSKKTIEHLKKWWKVKTNKK